MILNPHLYCSCSRITIEYIMIKFHMLDGLNYSSKSNEKKYIVNSSTVKLKDDVYYQRNHLRFICLELGYSLS